MAEHDRTKDNRTISHNLDDDLVTTLGERLAAEEREKATRTTPSAPEQVGERGAVGSTDAPDAPDEGAGARR